MEQMVGDYALGDGPFAFDLVRAEDLARAYGVEPYQVHTFLADRGAVRMTRYCEGLRSTGVRPVRLWAIRNVEAWTAKGPKARTLAYFAAQGAA